MRKIEKGWIFPLLCLLLAAGLTACHDAGGQSQPPLQNTLIYANLRESGPDREAIDEFNHTHKDVQIEVRDYLDAEGNGDKTRLLAEIMAGKGPDIIDMGYTADASTTLLPYQRMAQAGYLEDLWPYIENDTELGRGAVLEPPLKAAEVNGGLYIAFPSVRINTLVGAESVVGDRTSWTLAELRKAFASMPSDSTVLNYSFSRRDAFVYISCMCLDSYVDWETGQCRFDSEGFRSLVEFVKDFPEESPFDVIDSTDFDAVMAINEELVERLYGGRQMLEQSMIGRLEDIQVLDNIFGGKASFVGYPVEDGSIGSSFSISGRSLAMSSTCRNKEAAWDFLRQTFLPKGNRAPSGPIPINRSDYELSKKCDISTTISRGVARPEYTYIIRRATEEEEQRYESLIYSIDKIELCDMVIFDIAQETLGAYFAGDRPLDDTIRLLESRVGLYLNENR
ncbi:MAG: extracellular solute-binding protein [Oscillibacter sp.]|nr:extracellular solute-binding protein [Oscillibacter sp.]